MIEAEPKEVCAVCNGLGRVHPLGPAAGVLQGDGLLDRDYELVTCDTCEGRGLVATEHKSDET